MTYPIGMTCQELVELVTDYLEDALQSEQRERFEAHLAVCPGCVEYLQQIRLTIEATGAVTEESLEPQIRDALLSAFRNWRHTG
jgi:anti-sigma factor RsiW